MKLATTTADFYLKYKQDPIDAIKCYENTGFKYFDYSFYNDAKKNSLLMQDDYLSVFKDIRKQSDKLGYKYVQAHSPGGNPLKFDDDYEMLLESTVRSIKACKILGIPNIVVHSGYIGMVSEQEYFEKNGEFYKKLFPVMEETGVSVLVENGTPANAGDNTFFFTGDEVRRFLEFVNHPLLGACWDTGHGNIEQRETQYKSITDLGKHLKALHIADNLGFSDDHFSPFFGIINFDEIMCALKDINYKGYFTFECTNLMLDAGWTFPRKTYAGMNKLYKPSVDLKKQAIKLMYIIGEHILRSYDLFEE